EDVIVAEIDLEAVKACRAKIPNLKNGRDFALDIAPVLAKGGVTV
ncbi:MAG: carbon-nitrogen hydrolase family protein, partial [Rhizobium rosettiformans]